MISKLENRLFLQTPEAVGKPFLAESLVYISQRRGDAENAEEEKERKVIVIRVISHYAATHLSSSSPRPPRLRASASLKSSKLIFPTAS